MRARHIAPFALVAAAAALAACGDDGYPRRSEAPPAEIEFAQDEPLPPAPASPPPAVADAAAGTPAEPVPYDQLQADAKKAPAQKADAENENVFY